MARNLSMELLAAAAQRWRFLWLEKEVFILTPVSAVPNFTHSLLKERENNEHESDDDDCVAKVLSS